MTFYATFLLSITTVFCLNACKSVNSPDNETDAYSWVETDTSVALRSGTQTLWQYNYNTKEGKPFFHPLKIDETSITELSPSDHPWHLGLWFSWKYINGVNYWEYIDTDKHEPWNYAGKTIINSVRVAKKSDFSCVINLELSYWENGSLEVLRESRVIEVSKPIDQLFHIDYTFQFKALSDVVELNRTPLVHEKNGQPHGGYAGLSLRFNNALSSADLIGARETDSTLHGAAASWMYYGLQTQEKQRIGVVIYDHPENVTHPTPWHITADRETPLYFLQPAPIFYTPITLSKQEALTLRYRVKFLAGTVDRDQLEQGWKAYLKG